MPIRSIAHVSPLHRPLKRLIGCLIAAARGQKSFTPMVIERRPSHAQHQSVTAVRSTYTRPNPLHRSNAGAFGFWKRSIVVSYLVLGDRRRSSAARFDPTAAAMPSRPTSMFWPALGPTDESADARLSGGASAGCDGEHRPQRESDECGKWDSCIAQLTDGLGLARNSCYPPPNFMQKIHGFLPKFQ